MIKFISQAKLPTRYGEFDIHVFLHHSQEHLVLSKGVFEPEDVVLTRIHSECLTGDSLFSLRCDCGPQLQFALSEISKQDKGLLIYLRQEGRGIGLLEKIKAYQLQDQGLDTFEANIELGHKADNRNYDMLEAVFKHFNVNAINIMTNNPEKVSAIERSGIVINQRLPITIGHNAHNKKYLQTKRDKFGHFDA